jgi:hypothetical protein
VLEHNPPISRKHSTSRHIDANFGAGGQASGAQYIKEFRMGANARAAARKGIWNAFENVGGPPSLRQKPRRH